MFFEYPEDKVFFMNLFRCDKEKDFDSRFYRFFDFRLPDLKRKEFNGKRNTLYRSYFAEGRVCQLKLIDTCSQSGSFAIDHMIPLSSNELNKNIRKLEAMKGKKVQTQSFGSNHRDNLLLACRECNDFKKHRMGNFLKEIIRREILS